MVLEIMGRPPENIKEALQTLSLKIGSEKGVKLISKEIHEPIPLEGSKDLFTTFADLSLEADSLSVLNYILFSYMPSHIEITSPQSLIMSNTEMNDLSNNIARRLHHYDAIAKQMLAEKEIILKQLYQYAPHLFKKQESNQQVQQSQQTKQKQESKKENKKSKAKPTKKKKK